MRLASLRQTSPFFAPIVATLLALVILAVCASTALAAPTLSADAYPAAAGQPTAASYTVDGGPAIACQLQRATDGSVTPVCDLASAAPGTHTIVLTVSNVYGCTAAADGSGATCVGGGSASSDPFTYTWSASAVSKPARRFRP